MTQWQPGMRITAERLQDTGIQSATLAVTFPKPYPTAPIVQTEIVSGAGATARWGSRAININSTGFTLFLFITDAANTPATWTNIPVQWIATAT
ncbi:hypothetical protein H9Y04_44150 [Streptomyces sp. TRM66268-LWL]|uniref:H-type lectin domain-containing protein n=1 Tax=Streptomyces polyasparticus TaxID=2767826 RepID=A0ABR7SXJ9_9ACTN|nr:hypothetical protein [Streptomyces polyasparticus]MBC9719514.1 hypothetical protein [Streptomyces polyasparticus]